MVPGVVVCMPIVFSRVEESKATFHKIKDVSFFFFQTMQIRKFVPHWWQTEGGRDQRGSCQCSCVTLS